MAALFPGRQYTPDRPLLYFAREVFLAHGWSVEEVWWDAEDLITDESLQARVKRELEQVADRDPVVLGKSVGTLAVPLVSELNLPAIWLTPLFDRPELVSALNSVKSKTLLVGGTDDEFWDSAVAKATGLQILELPGGDHNLEIAGNPLASVRFLSELLMTIESFVKDL